jgi:heme A synthase
MNSKLALGAVVLLVIGITTVLIAVQTPAILLLLGSLALAVLHILARRRSRYDPLDPRFGGCIPPISKPGDR